MAGIVLKVATIDGDVFELTTNQAQKSATLQTMLSNLDITDPNDARLQEPIDIQVSTNAFRQIHSWLIENENVAPRVKNPEEPRIQLSDHENEFMKQFINDEEVLTGVLMGANFLEIQALLDIVTQAIANACDGKSVEELREMFHLTNDFTPEEEESIRKRFEWVEK